MLEPTIDKHDQFFLDNWCSKPFFLSLVKDIVQFCEKNVAETTSEINKTETSLRSNTNQEQFKAIKTEIQSNETATKKILQQRKFKKSINPKHKPKSTIQPTPTIQPAQSNQHNPTNTIQPTPQQELEAQEQSKKYLHSEILKRKRSKTNKKKV